MNLFTETHAILISFAFLFQLFFISIFMSRAWRKSRQVLLNKYPQKVFANLYAQDEEVEQKRLRVRQLFDYLAFTIGLVTFMAVQFAGTSPNSIADWMLLIALVQLSPMFISAYWCNQNSQILSKRYPKTIRTAQLECNRLSDFISKTKIMASVAAYIVSVGFAAYTFLVLRPYELKAVYLIALSTTVVFYVCFLVWKLVYGQKKDHFIDQQERAIKISETLNYLIISLTAYSGFVTAVLTFNLFHLSDIYIGVLASIFAQAIVFKTRNQYYPINPSVYKDAR